jgi:hypothetical protein
MDLTLIGYLPKRVQRPPGWLPDMPSIDQICSVGDCFSPAPEDRISFWKHNAMWLYDDETTTMSIVPLELQHEFTLFAYKMLPSLFNDGDQKTFNIPELHVAPLSQDYIRIGYDAVGWSGGTGFDCSPLSCNLRAPDYKVNRYCLVDTLEEAITMAKDFSKGGGEPGPYFVFEVWRKSSPNQAVHRIADKPGSR